MEPTQGAFMTVPAPSQSGEVAPAYINSASDGMGLPNQEVHIAKIQNNLVALEEANLNHDARYSQMIEIRERLQGLKSPFFDVDKILILLSFR